MPSLFFLGDNGVPLAIATEICTTVDALHEVIRAVQQPTADPSVTPAPAQAVAPNTTAAASSSTAAAAAIQPSPTPSNTSATATGTSVTPAAAAAVEERLRHAKAVLEQKRKEHEVEQQRLEKEREQERRRSGQDLRSFKERQTELELKQMKEERKRDQIAEQVRRKRILEQIAQDRAMSAARFANNTGMLDTAAQASAAVPATPRVYTGNEARIQFRKPDGTVAAHDFLAADTFQTLRDYVATDLLAGCSNFTLASSFPRRLFGNEDVGFTLAELELAPTAVILVQSSDKSLQAGNNSAAASQGAGATSAVRGAAAAVGRLNVFGMAQTTFWTLMMPVLALVNYVRSLLGGRGADAGAQKRANEERVSDNDA